MALAFMALRVREHAFTVSDGRLRKDSSVNYPWFHRLIESVMRGMTFAWWRSFSAVAGRRRVSKIRHICLLR